MNPTSQQFIDFQKTLTECKQKINQILQAKPDGVYAYYIAPLSNILQIKMSKVIYSRSQATGFTDLSNQNVQDNREKSVEVVRGEVSKRVKIHQCVNLFLNPFNHTYWQFRRNALIRATDDPFTSAVGIIEFDLEKLFSLSSTAWFVSNGNLAANSGGGMEYPFPNYKEFNWSEIYSIAEKKDDLNHSRSAEILIHYQDKESEKGLPIASANRLLALESDLSHVGDYGEKLKLCTFQDIGKYSALSDPLINDCRLAAAVKNIVDLEKSTYVITRSIRRLSRFEQETGLKLNESYISNRIAFGKDHGMDHSIRTMFWISVLAEIGRNKGIIISEEEKTAALYAGFFHDLCRQNDYAEPSHGPKAADHFRKEILRRLPADYAERCLFAIKCHSNKDDPTDSDLIWQLLKDADALDRGRLGGPNSASGCKEIYFRLPFLPEGSALVNELMWAGYFLPRVCSSINWTDRPCQDFTNNLFASFSAVIVYRNGNDNHIIPETMKRIIDTYRSVYGI